jgi:hypothetical protein
LHDVHNSNQSLQYYKRDKKTRLAPKELLEVHPLGKSPVITDDGVTIAESGAIVEYLLEKYDTTRRFSPSETPIIAGDKRIDNPKLTNLYYTHFAEGSLMPYLVNIVIFKVVPQQMPWFLRWLLKPIFNKITEKVVIPNVYNAAKLVSPPLWFSLQKSRNKPRICRLRMTWRNRPQAGSLVDPSRLLQTLICFSRSKSSRVELGIRWGQIPRLGWSWRTLDPRTKW